MIDRCHETSKSSAADLINIKLPPPCFKLSQQKNFLEHRCQSKPALADCNICIYFNMFFYDSLHVYVSSLHNAAMATCQSKCRRLCLPPSYQPSCSSCRLPVKLSAKQGFAASHTRSRGFPQHLHDLQLFVQSHSECKRIPKGLEMLVVT